MLAQAEGEIMERGKAVLERLMKEVRTLHLGEHPGGRGNGFYERALLARSAPIEDLRVARIYRQAHEGRRGGDIGLEGATSERGVLLGVGVSLMLAHREPGCTG